MSETKYGKPTLDLSDHERRDLHSRTDRLQAAYERLESKRAPTIDQAIVVIAAQSDLLALLSRIVLESS